jgi:uncharacterized protein (UPF0335 family)
MLLPTGEVMTNQEKIKEFIDKYKRLEGELELLRDEKKELFDDYKDHFTPKVLREAIRIAKVRVKLGDAVVELDNIVNNIEGRV